MIEVSLCDSLFISGTNSAFLGGDRVKEFPKSFKWCADDADHARFVTDSDIKHAKGEGQVAWLLEPFLMHPENYFEALKKPFDHVLTHNRWWADNYRHEGWLWYPHGGSWIKEGQWGQPEKTKRISLLLSTKTSMPGHKLRHQIADLFGDHIDVIGTGARYGKWVDIYEAYAPYEYSIIVDNESSPGYFTEKLVDCVSVGTIPIYWGAPDIFDFLPYNSLFRFTEIGELRTILGIARQQEYDILIKSHANTYRDFARKYAVCEDQIFLRYPFLFEESC